MAFQAGGLAAAVELIILIPILKNRLSRLIAGTNLFLLVGGIGFFFQSLVITSFLAHFQEAGVFLFVGVVSVLAFIFSETGAFEVLFSNARLQKIFSFYFLLAITVAFVWSYMHRGSPLSGGVLPFIFLIILKYILQRRLAIV